jgi:hypothetical protein
MLMTYDKKWLAKMRSDPARDTQLLQSTKEAETYPLVGYSIATISVNAALLTLEFVVPPPDAGTRIVRLGMTRKQCTELSEALKRLAVVPHRPQSMPS